MGKSQRNKGAGYEREVCDVLTAATGRKIQRHIGQARDGGNDITVGKLIVECKRRKTLGTVEGWLRQATAAKVSAEQAAIVVARSDGGESLAIMSLADFLRLIDKGVLSERHIYFPRAMGSAYGARLPVGAGKDAGSKLGDVGSGAGETHSEDE